MESKETKRETSDFELPEWYEVTEHGGIRFISGLLANYMAANVNAFYGAGSYITTSTGYITPVRICGRRPRSGNL